MSREFSARILVLMNAARWMSIACVLVAFLAFTGANAAILSAKRGFADTGAGYNNLQASGAGWYYTWGTGAGNPGNFDANHYPMFWSAPSPTTINNIKSRNPVYVLGFNEPERSDQANMSVAQAISSWTTISNSFTGTSTKLVSPAVSDTGDGQAWMASFMQQANAGNLQVDAVAFHWYGASTPSNPAGAASSFLSRVDSYHNSYGLPVFITEFAIHDWGGAYSDAEIIEANRQFLDIVVPALESRSYVAGYSWYQWFSDANLYSGSPSKPTPMGYKYVGAVASGEVQNISGQDLGEHVAYLTGGELTMSGPSGGTIRYINALANTSTISGNIAWGPTGSNWVRIQPGATLRKIGANQISFGTGVTTNDGVLEVSEGTLHIGSAITGSGNVHVKSGGVLTLTGLGNFGTTPLIDVQGGGTIDGSALSRGITIGNGQTIHNRPNGTILGRVNANTGGTIAGAGEIVGNVLANFGANVRVGGEGLVASRIAVDNFESYVLGDVRTTASPPWNAHQNTSLADIESFSGNKVLTYGWASEARGVSRSLPDTAVIENDETATLFFRFNSKTDDPDHNFGMGDRASKSVVDFGDFEAQLRLKQGTTAGTYALDARSGGSFTATLASSLTLNTWYNVWMVVNQSTDTYDLYMNTGTSTATGINKLNSSPLIFRNGTASDLNTILGLASAAPLDNGVRFDDLVRQSGVDLTNPMSGFDPGLTWAGETLTIDGNYTQNAGAKLAIELGGTGPGQYDVLDVSGTATLDGSLEIGLPTGFVPQIGYMFPVLNAASVTGWLGLTGALDGFSLMSTESGLALYFGELPAGDYDRNGTVEPADFDDWKEAYGATIAVGADGNGDGVVDAGDFTVWRDNLGATVISEGAGGSVLSVPEPSSILFAASVLTIVSLQRRRCPQSRVSS